MVPGPESLLLMAATAGRPDLDEFARLEYSLAEAPCIAASLLREFEAMPTKRATTGSIFRRGARWLRRGDAVEGGMDSITAKGGMATSVSGRAVEAPCMAALPSLGEPLGEGLSPLPALPRLERA